MPLIESGALLKSGTSRSIGTEPALPLPASRAPTRS